MKSNEDLIREWIELADQDLGTAKIIFERIPEYREVIGFHCQQAIEKYLKGFLIHLEIGFDKSHDLLYLINSINTEREIISNSLYERAKGLSPFAVRIRYPLGRFDATVKDMKPYIELADEFRNEILSQLNLK